MTINTNANKLREFEFTYDDFSKIKKLIYDWAGISLNDNKQEMVYSRLARRLRATHCSSFKDYLSSLQSGNNKSEWEHFTNALTTNLTSFFRESHHFPILSDHLLSQNSKPLKVWCSAASTGEEPYSLAITAMETFNSYTPPVQIIASDIDTNVLAKASDGVYPIDRVNKLSSDRIKKYFLKGKNQFDGMARVRKELRDLITFKQVNLLAESYDMGMIFDVIFCRNVMIYFDKETQYKILKRFVPLLQPNGLLFTGHSESFLHASDLFKPLGKTVYRRADFQD